MRSTLCSLLILALLAPALPGCVVFEIRDELKASNDRIDKLQGQMDQTVTIMERIDKTMAETQTTIKRADAAVESSEASLKQIQAEMEPIRISLRRVDDELRAIVQVVSKASDKIPFVDIKPEQPLPVRQEPTRETTPQKPAATQASDRQP